MEEVLAEPTKGVRVLTENQREEITNPILLFVEVSVKTYENAIPDAK